MKEDRMNEGIELLNKPQPKLPEEFSKLSTEYQNLFRRLLYERKFNLIIEKKEQELSAAIVKQVTKAANFKKMPLRKKRKAK
jgi:hypothetical protein